MPLSKFSRAKPIRQMVHESLRQAIIEGEFPGGARLLEEELAKKEDSRTPVREALRKLEAEGLIAHVPGKGATVLGFTRDDVAELYSIREALEALAITYTIRNITEEEIAQLKGILEETRRHLRDDDPRRLFEGSQRFNDLLIETCKMPRLITAVNTYRGYRHRLRFTTIGKNKQRLLEAWKEHEEILQAIVEKNSAKAESLVRRHLRNAKRAHT